MKVFQIKRIIPDLFRILAKIVRSPDLKLQDKNNTVQKQYDINPLAQTGDRVFKNDLTFRFVMQNLF